MLLKAKKVKPILKQLLLLFLFMQFDSFPSLPFSPVPTAQLSPCLRVGGPADWQAVTGESQSVIPDKPRLLLNVVEQWIQWLETEQREPEKHSEAAWRKATAMEQEVFSLFRASSIMLGEMAGT